MKELVERLNAFHLKTHFTFQKPMRKVEISLIPIILFAVWSFGFRTLTLLIAVTIAAILSEYIIMYSINKEKAKVSEAVLVTSFLYTLTLPPSVPYWTAIIGIVFGIVFGKGAFGGFGKNIFNPALVGRCFIYITFPAQMTVKWLLPFGGFPGGFLNYSGEIDAITSSTPMILAKNAGEIPSYLRLFLGTISGSLGETSALLILISAIYLIWTKTASWKIMLSSTVTFVLLNSIFYFSGQITNDPLFSLLSGGFLFAVVFMATDPISAPVQDLSKIIYGILIATLAFVIRSYALFTEGIMFAILIANIFSCLIDKYVKDYQSRKKVTA